MTIKDDAQVLESMVLDNLNDEDSIIDFETDMSIEDRKGLDMVILDPKERKENVDDPDTKQDIKDDYEYARNTYIQMIEQGQEVLKGILEMTEQGPNPRAFEVAGQHMKIISDNADKLMKHHKDNKEVNATTKENTSQTAETINNVVFNGSAEQLIDMLNGEDVEIIEDDSE